MTGGEKLAALLGGLGLAGIGAFALWRARKPDAPDGDVELPPDRPTAVSEEVEALARAIASEAGNQSQAIQVAVGFAILNESIRRGVTLWTLVRGRSGAWGSQATNGYVSSARAPSAGQTELARQILAGDLTDPTGGAVQFDVPKLQRKLHEKDPDKYKTPEQVAAARRADGRVLVLLAGVPEEDFRLWRPRA